MSHCSCIVFRPFLVSKKNGARLAALSLFIGNGSEELENPLGAAEVADAVFVRPHYLGGGKEDRTRQGKAVSAWPQPDTYKTLIWQKNVTTSTTLSGSAYARVLRKTGPDKAKTASSITWPKPDTRREFSKNMNVWHLVSISNCAWELWGEGGGGGAL